MRELKKDSVFLEKERMKQKNVADNELKEKMNNIMSTLQKEQHHFNVSKREQEKNKKKKSF